MNIQVKYIKNVSFCQVYQIVGNTQNERIPPLENVGDQVLSMVYMAWWT